MKRPVIFITPSLSAHPHSGGQIRSHRLVSGLARHGEVTLVVVGSVDDIGSLGESTGVREVVVFPELASPWQKRAVAVRRGWPLRVARTWQPTLADWLGRRPEALIVLDDLRVTGYRPVTGRYVVCLQNHDSRLLKDQGFPQDPMRALEHAWDRVTLPAFERRLVDDPRALVLAVSELDARGLGPRVGVIRNGTDLPDDVPGRPETGSLLFVGALDYPPNKEALGWWVDEVWPRLSPDLPPLRVVGRGGAAQLGHLARHPALDVVGEVDDVASELAVASVVVVPLRSGSGTRLKVLEALAWRRPVVTTRKGAEGLPVQHDRDVLIADEPDAFAEAVTRVWGDAVVADRLATRGAEVVRSYDWTTIGDELAVKVFAFACSQ